MVDGTSKPGSKRDAASPADATQSDATPGQTPASATPDATPAEGTAATPRPAEVQSANPGNASAVPTSRRGLSKLAAAVGIVDGIVDFFWSDLDGQR